MAVMDDLERGDWGALEARHGGAAGQFRKVELDGFLHLVRAGPVGVCDPWPDVGALPSMAVRQVCLRLARQRVGFVSPALQAEALGHWASVALAFDGARGRVLRRQMLSVCRVGVVPDVAGRLLSLSLWDDVVAMIGAGRVVYWIEAGP